jgi:hypothetical protein
MSKNVFLRVAGFTLLLFIADQTLKAQNTSPFWSLAGNSNASNTTSKLGTTNSVSLRLFTKNVERIRIDTLGRVGIGTTVPTFKLHVNGNGLFTTGVQINSGGLKSTFSTGVAVQGISTFSTGVLGNSSEGFGVSGVTNSGNAINGQSNTGIAVYGESTADHSVAIEGRSPYIAIVGYGDSYGVYGSNSTGGFGVYGQSEVGTGVFGGSGLYGVQGNGDTCGVYGTSITTGVNGTGGSVGVYGSSTDTTGSVYGVFGKSRNTGLSYGVYGDAVYAVYGSCAYTKGIAVSGIASGSGTVGGSFKSSLSIGVFASTSNANSWAGDFVGRVNATGGYFQVSDRQLKQNITEVDNAMNIINKLQPKYYAFRQDGDYKLMNLPQGKHYGLIAQDVEQVLPDLVANTELDGASISPTKEGSSANINAKTTNAETGSIQQEGIIHFKALNYTELIPIMIKAMQELSKKTDEIDLLKKDNEELRKEIEDLKSLVLKTAVVGNGYNLSGASLEQNTPNPFKSGTSIRYFLPDGIGSAKIIITDESGRIMKSIALTSIGEGEINLNTSTFAAGSYNYTLWLDGKKVDSKKMIVAK